MQWSYAMAPPTFLANYLEQSCCQCLLYFHLQELNSPFLSCVRLKSLIVPNWTHENALCVANKLWRNINVQFL